LLRHSLQIMNTCCFHCKRGGTRYMVTTYTYSFPLFTSCW
jgi:hypothetical protein